MCLKLFLNDSEKSGLYGTGTGCTVRDQDRDRDPDRLLYRDRDRDGFHFREVLTGSGWKNPIPPVSTRVMS